MRRASSIAAPEPRGAFADCLAAGRKNARILTMRRVIPRVVVCLAIVAAIAAPAHGQEMEPKAYSASPIGANFLVTSVTRSSGSVISDGTLPISDVKANVNGLAFGYGHSFNLFGDLGLITIAIPVASATVKGQVFEQTDEVTRTGLSDIRIKLSVNLIGNPAMTPREFASARRRTIVGTSVTMIAPAGQYDPTRLVNLGANRWALKPEVGVSVPRGRWDLDAYLGVWLFGTNPKFFPGGSRRTQDSMLAFQGHASYTLRPRFWIAVNGTWYRGGSSRVSDGDSSPPLNNSRLGATVSFPIGVRHSIKAAYGSGVIVRKGSDFRTVTIGWQVLWLSPRWAGR
jgi:hypothetical protein